MRKPRPENYDPKVRQPKPDEVNLSGVVPLHAKIEPVDTSIPTKTPMIQSEPKKEDGIPSHHDIVVSEDKEPSPTQDIGDFTHAIRKAVKEYGKEPATHRFTLEEKNEMDEIEYNYKKRFGIRTSENEITRIAINYIFEDLRKNGELSVLHQVLVSLSQ